MTDVVMPGGMSSRQVAEQALRMRADLAVLFTSGYTDDSVLREGRMSPGDAFLAKPYRRAKLAEAVAGALLAKPSPSGLRPGHGQDAVGEPGADLVRKRGPAAAWNDGS